MKRILIMAFFSLSAPAFCEWQGAAGRVEITPDFSNPVYLAGYGAKGRKATGVHDPLWARGLAVSDGRTSAVLISLDLIGFPRPYVERIRKSFPQAYILIASNHTHSGPDTLGMWGPRAGKSGVDEVYMEEISERVESLIRLLLKNLTPVDLWASKISVPPEGLVKDLRDPTVIDNELRLLQLKPKGSRKVMGALVNWSCHPEVLGPDNTLVTRDFSGYLVDRLDKEWGSVTVFFSGAIGGLMSPDASAPTFEEAERIGLALAGHAKKAAASALRLGVSRLRTFSALVRIPVENNLYLALMANVSHGRALYNPDGTPWKPPYWDSWPVWMRPFMSWADTRIFKGKIPLLETEAALIRLDGATLAAVPGELFPEMLLGGYQGSLRFHHPLLSPDNPAPPDLKQAPQGPYLSEQMPGNFRFLLGLANDEIGYLLPEYDFKLNRKSPFLSPMPKGHHYEETNSVGSRAGPLVTHALEKLFREGR